MKLAHRLLVVLAAWCLLMPSVLLAQSPQNEPLRVGSKRFTESYILAEIVAQTARQAGARTELRQGLGNTAIVHGALRSGQIDVYAEYTGTIAQEIVKDASKNTLTDLNRALASQGLAVGVPLGFNNGYALAMRRDVAQRLGITRLSDLAQHPELRYGLSNEFMGRADGWAGLAQRYDLKARPQGLDHGLAYEAIRQQHIDVMDIYTTDAKIDYLGLLVLQDDKDYFPHYDAVLLYRSDLPQRQPAAWAVLQSLQSRIDESAMIRMNAQAELQGMDFAQIAQRFLQSDTKADAAAPSSNEIAKSHSFGALLWRRLAADDLGRLVGQHLLLVLLSVGAAALIAIPAGILLFPHARLRALALGIAGVMQTIPSLALLAVLIAAMGVIGRAPALVALTAYSILPILSNTCAGLAEVSPGLRNAGLALGMTKPQLMRWVELPIAMPTITAGLRTACAIAIGTATIAAFIGAGGLGERIVTGLALNDSALMLAGALPAAGLALISELSFELWERTLRHRQLRRSA
ncbi:ABC transporter permease/substrate-binding protein [Comamonas guangdongensis]|uniref:Glycine betaine ABC transporter substrate-binding protein n=1 Tax=Comamonas guangdongensis TaxID=510515 RepID=A0ABV3ZYK8_9BURK